MLSGDTDVNGTLNLEARMFDSPSGGSGTQILKREIELPAGALVGDALAPRPELKNLAVGQSWTVPVYRPFPPDSPPQIIQATVKHLEPILWEGNEVETMLVLYQSEAGSNINIASDINNNSASMHCAAASGRPMASDPSVLVSWETPGSQ